MRSRLSHFTIAYSYCLAWTCLSGESWVKALCGLHNRNSERLRRISCFIGGRQRSENVSPAKSSKSASRTLNVELQTLNSPRKLLRAARGEGAQVVGDNPALDNGSHHARIHAGAIDDGALEKRIEVRCLRPLAQIKAHAVRRHGITIKLTQELSIPGRVVAIQAESILLELPRARGGKIRQRDGQCSAYARAKSVAFVELVAKGHR